MPDSVLFCLSVLLSWLYMYFLVDDLKLEEVNYQTLPVGGEGETGTWALSCYGKAMLLIYK